MILKKLSKLTGGFLFVLLRDMILLTCGGLMFRANFVIFFLLLTCAAPGVCSHWLYYHGLSPSWNMDVVYAPVMGRTSIIGVYASDILVEDIRSGSAQGTGECRKFLYDAVCDEMLAWYHFIPEIEGGNWQDDDWWNEGVREILCTTKPFFSLQLELCCEAVLGSVRGRSSRVTDTGHPSWRKLDWGHVEGRLYPKGKTRQWSVVCKSSVGKLSLKDCVYICFPKKDYAFEGVLCDCAEKLAVTSLDGRRETFYKRGIEPRDWALTSDQNLFALKLLKNSQRGRVRGGYCSTEEIPYLSASPLNILNPHYSGQWNVSVVYCTGAGVDCRGMFDFSRVTVDRGQGSLCMLDALIVEAFEGLKVKYSGELSEKHARIVKRPEVRDVTCVRTKWRSAFLERAFFGAILKYWAVPGFRYVLGNLRSSDVCGLVKHPEQHERFVWSLKDAKDLKKILYCKKGVVGHMVFVSVKGLSVAMQGRCSSLRRNFL